MDSSLEMWKPEDDDSELSDNISLRMLFSHPDLQDDLDTDRQTALFPGETATDQNAVREHLSH